MTAGDERDLKRRARLTAAAVCRRVSDRLSGTPNTWHRVLVGNERTNSKVQHFDSGKDEGRGVVIERGEKIGLLVCYGCGASLEGGLNTTG